MSSFAKMSTLSDAAKSPPGETVPLTSSKANNQIPNVEVFGADDIQKRQFLKNAWGKTAAYAKGTYAKGRNFLLSQYVQFKQDPRRGPLWISGLAIIAAVVLIPGLFVDLVTQAFTLSPLSVLCDIYGILGCLLVLAAEISRTRNPFGIRMVLHYYFAFIEYCVGRGIIQLLVASLTVTNIVNLFKFIPGTVLLGVGFLNILYGVYAAFKLNAMLARLREEEFEGKTMAQKLDLLDRKFEALDKRGDGKLTKEDLREGITELKLDISALELDAIFQVMDADRNGYIDKSELETWWFQNKASMFL